METALPPQKDDHDMFSAASTTVADGCSSRESERARTRSRHYVYKQSIGSKETMALRWMKVVFLVVLTISSSIVGMSVFFYLEKAELSEFRDKYSDFASKIFNSMQEKSVQMLGNIDAFGCMIDSFAEATESAWPLVTVPEFAKQTDKFLSLAKVVHARILPVVPQNDRATWESYAASQNKWVGEVAEMQGISAKEVPIWDSISNVDVDGESRIEPKASQDGFYLPVWQNSPLSVATPAYNWNSLQDEDRYLEALHNSTQMSITNSFTVDKLGHTNSAEKFMERIVGNISDHGGREPVASVLYPLGANGSDTEVAAILEVTFALKDLIRGVLPDDTGNIDVVFMNGCSRSYTYRVMGPEVVFMGNGDSHDRNFNNMRIIEPFVGFSKIEDRYGSGYRGPPVSFGKCEVQVHFYPTEDLESDFVSNRPITFSVILVSAFALTSAVFVIYDTCVEKRQNVVLFKAAQSAANESVLEEKVVERTRRLRVSNMRLAEANHQIVRASEAQLQHFACMSHEIRTPLNCIIGCSGLLKDSKLDPTQKESVDMITSSGDLLLSIVNDVLDYSRLESGNVEIEMKKTSLQRALDSVVWTMKAKAEANKLSLHPHFSMVLPTFLETDIRRLQQILYNLLGNAIKFSKEGGVVELHLDITKSPEPILADTYSPPRECSSIGNLVSPSWLQFKIKDYGKGIASKDFARIFKPFLQENSDTEVLYGGSGLGLAITTKLVHRMGGHISVASSVGEWSEFYVCLPIDLQQREENLDVVVNDLKKAEILLLSDKKEKIAGVESICKHNELTLTTATTQEEILTKSDKSKLGVFLVQDNLFNSVAWKNGVKPDRHVFLTFGPLGQITESEQHFRSLTQLIPSVLLKSLATHVARKLTEKSKVQAKTESKVEEAEEAVKVPYPELRLLMAEDNLINQKVLSRTLKRLGVKHLDIVDNGQKAVDKEAENRYDFILMDMQMPVMDGIDACKLIHERSEEGTHPRSTVIFVTAHAMQDIRDKCFAAGGYEFLTKPCNLKLIDGCFSAIYKKEPSLFPKPSDDGQSEE